jgi:butyryl-CoA dehydrogenase
MLLSDDHRAVQEAVRTYVQAEVAPHAAAWDKTHNFPAAQLQGLAALGCYGIAVPTEYDGAGLDYLSLALIIEESPLATVPPARWSASPTARCVPS